MSDIQAAVTYAADSLAHEETVARPAVTLPLEAYTQNRTREFDEAETELARLFTTARANR